MAARGIKTKVEGTDGSDFSYRQTIDDRYVLMAETKTNIKTLSLINTAYFGISIVIFLLQLVIPSLQEALQYFSAFYRFPTLFIALYTGLAFGTTYLMAEKPTTLPLFFLQGIVTLTHLIIAVLYPLFIYFTKPPVESDNLTYSILITALHALGYVTMILILGQCYSLRKLQKSSKRT